MEHEFRCQDVRLNPVRALPLFGAWLAHAAGTDLTGASCATQPGDNIVEEQGRYVVVRAVTYPCVSETCMALVNTDQA